MGRLPREEAAGGGSAGGRQGRTRGWYLMHNDGPVATLPVKAAGTMAALRFCLLLLLGVFVLCSVAKAAPAKGAETKQADPSQFVGSETCAT